MFKSLNKSDESTSNTETSDNSGVKNQNFILKDYPILKVPLYKGSTISSMKYFVHQYQNLRLNYHNVVFKSEDKKDDVFEFYRSKMSSIDQETSNESTVEGKIDIFKVSISNYGYEDYYLQVHAPDESFSEQNIYYENYPDLVEIAGDWVEYENTYGLLNQKGGEIEYTRWLEVDVSGYDKDSLMIKNPIGEYYKIYKEKYSQKQDFVADDEAEKLTWIDGDYTVWAVFSTDHGRVYLTFRKPMN